MKLENVQLRDEISQQSSDIDKLNQEMVALANDNRSMIDKITAIGNNVKIFEVTLVLY